MVRFLTEHYFLSTYAYPSLNISKTVRTVTYISWTVFVSCDICFPVMFQILQSCPATTVTCYTKQCASVLLVQELSTAIQK